MKKILASIVACIVIALGLFINVNSNVTEQPNDDINLANLISIASASAEGTSCKTTCENGEAIEVENCQFCSSRNREYVKCYDSSDNLIEEKICEDIPNA